MGLNDFFKKTKSSSEHSTYGLTTLGKQKAEKYTSNNPQATIMSHLDENGVSTITEIASEIRMSPQKVKLILKQLMRSGYVRKVNQEE